MVIQTSEVPNGTRSVPCFLRFSNQMSRNLVKNVVESPAVEVLLRAEEV